MASFLADTITKLYILWKPCIPYQSLLFSTTVLNDILAINLPVQALKLLYDPVNRFVHRRITTDIK